MLQRTTLLTGEYSRVEQLAHHLCHSLWSLQSPRIFEVLAHEDNTTTRTAESLVGCRCNDVGILNRVVEQSCGDKTSGMCHVDHKQCSYLVGNLTHTLVIPLTAICRTTTDDKLWLVLDGKSFHLVIIHESRFSVKVVTDGVVENAGGVDL